MTSQARRLRLTDLPVLAWHSRRVYPNQAITLAAQHRPSPWRLLRTCLLPGAGGRIWISRDGGTLLGVAALRPRSGRSAWEIDTLLSPLDNEAYLLDLLDRAVATAGAASAHRLFLRLPLGSPALEPARRHGFVAVTEETLYSSAGSSPAAAPSPARRRRHADDLSLFQLYCRNVPQEVRWQTALAPAEWRATLDPLGDGGDEWLLPTPDGASLAAFLRLSHSGADTRASLLTDGEPRSAEAALALARDRTGPGRRLQLLLPDYAVSEARAAEALGLTPAARFQLLVRAIAQRVRRLQLAEQPVEGSPRPVLQ